MMEMLLRREPSDAVCTQGQLFVDGATECFTLEPPVREVKIAGITAIPAGRYQVVITYSPHFGRPLPLLLKVPNYVGVRIHPGNDAADTEGCITVGETMSQDFNGDSGKAYAALYPKIESALASGEPVWITVQ